MSATVRQWDPRAEEWRYGTVRTSRRPAPRKQARTRRPAGQRAPLDHAGSMPAAPYWVDTAYADQGPLADLRSWIKPPAMRTHRAAVTMPADPGRITDV